MYISSKISKAMTLFIVMLFSTSFILQAEAKRGCSSFGHSCFGGHGKRSNSFGDLGNNPNLRDLTPGGLLNSHIGQDEIAAPKPIYPQTANDILGIGDDIIPIRNGGFMDNNDEINEEQLRLRLSPIIKNWLNMYRKSSEGNAYFNNLN